MRLFFPFLIFLFACNSSRLSKREKSQAENNPPGTVKLTNSLYIDQTEISNVHWREYVSYQLRKFGDTSLEYINSLPDTLVWSELELAWELSNIYFRHPSFNNSPAVGMSYEQATAFCKWRTYMVNQMLTMYPNGKFKKVLYRLPTIDEWRLAASNGIYTDTSAYGMKKAFDKRGRSLIFCKDYITGERKLSDGTRFYTTTVNSFYPNSLGLYHLAGNVSEMVSEEGKAMGGNFKLPLDSCRVTLIHPYIKPEPWLGFRCICEVIE